MAQSIQTPTSIFIPRYVDSLVFDATLEETHTTELEITDHPIESGTSINDHVYLQPKEITIRAYVSNDDIKGVSGGTGTGEIHDSSLSNIQSGVSGYAYGSNEAKITAAYDALLLMQELGLLITVQTGLKLYENMAVKRLFVKQDLEYEKGIIFECDMKQLTVVNTQYVKYSKDKFYTKGSKDNKKKVIKSQNNQTSQRASNKSESPTNRGAINNTSVQDDIKVKRRKSSALCKILNNKGCA